MTRLLERKSKLLEQVLRVTNLFVVVEYRDCTKHAIDLDE